MFRAIKLWFTNRDYYYQRKRYMKLQKEFRNKLIKQSREFCPWSGWYMHEMIKTMLEFYEKTYSAGDCCWSEECRTLQKAKVLKEARSYVEKLDAIDDMECKELLEIAKTFDDFNDFCIRTHINLDTTTDTMGESIKGYAAFEFLEKKYTETLYNIIGKHIWEWCD